MTDLAAALNPTLAVVILIGVAGMVAALALSSVLADQNHLDEDDDAA